MGQAKLIFKEVHPDNQAIEAILIKEFDFQITSDDLMRALCEHGSSLNQVYDLYNEHAGGKQVSYVPVDSTDKDIFRVVIYPGNELMVSTRNSRNYCGYLIFSIWKVT